MSKPTTCTADTVHRGSTTRRYYVVMMACFVRRQHASAVSWIADRARRIASLLLPQVGDVHDLFRACETAERVLRWSRISGSRRRSSTWVGGRPCVVTDLKPSSSATHSTPNLAWQMRVAFASMVSNTGFSSPGSSRVLAVRGWYRRPRAAMAFRRRCCLLGAALIVTGRLRWPRLSEQIFRGDVRGRLMLTQSGCLAGRHS